MKASKKGGHSNGYLQEANSPGKALSSIRYGLKGRIRYKIDIGIIFMQN